MRRIGAVFIAVAWSATSTSAATAAPDQPVAYVTGVRSAEDLIDVPDTHWIVASGLSEGKQAGAIHLIDRRKRTAEVLFPRGPLQARERREDYPDCPGPLDPTVLSAHGVALRQGDGGKHTLYVMNHGGREAVEAFELDVSGSAPNLTWIGCVPLPEGVLGNGVAPLPGGGFVATHMAVPRYFATPEAAKSAEAWIAKFMAEEPTGYAARWDARTGWSMVPGTEASGPNGIETSADGRWIWVANWPSREVARVAAGPDGSGNREVVKLDFLPDNLRWGGDGWLWVAGAAGPQADYFKCWSTPGCRNDYRIARIDPDTMRVEEVAHPDTSSVFGDATAVVRIGDELWLGAHPGDRVAVMPAPKPKR